MIDTRARRREAKRDEILTAAWALAHRDGVAGISLRELASMVDLRQPSLYAYFESKNDLYDAMFAESNRELVERAGALPPNDDPREAVAELARMLVGFATEDVARYGLMFQRTIPGFEPSPESYAIAVEFYEIARTRLAAAGITDGADMDLFTTLIAGVPDQQNANEPGGDRYVRLTDRVIAMFFTEIDRSRPTSKRKETK